MKVAAFTSLAIFTMPRYSAFVFLISPAIYSTHLLNTRNPANCARGIAFFSQRTPVGSRRRRVADRFAAMAAAGNLSGRLDALVGLVEWTRTADADAGADVPSDRSRLSKFVQVIESVPAARCSVQDTFAEVLPDTEGVNS